MTSTEAFSNHTIELLPIPLSEIEEWEAYIAEETSVDCEIIKHSGRQCLRYPEDDPRGVVDFAEKPIAGLLTLAKAVHGERPDITPQDFWNRIRIADERFKKMFADTDQDLAMSVTLQAALEMIFEAPPVAAHNTRLIQTIKCTAPTRSIPAMLRPPLPPPAAKTLAHTITPNRRSHSRRGSVVAGTVAASILVGGGMALVRVGSDGEAETAYAADAPAQTIESTTIAVQALDAPVVITEAETVAPSSFPTTVAESTTTLAAPEVTETAPVQEASVEVTPVTEAPAPATEAPAPTEPPVTEAVTVPPTESAPQETAPPETAPANDGTISRAGCKEIGGKSVEFAFGVKGAWEAVKITYGIDNDTQIARVINAFADEYKFRNVTASTPEFPVYECMPSSAKVTELLAS